MRMMRSPYGISRNNGMPKPIKTNFALVHRLLAQDPGLAIKLARSFVSQRKSMEFDHRFLGDTTHELGLMYFRLTPLCNLHCVMCGQRGVKGVLKGSFAVEEAKKNRSSRDLQAPRRRD